MPALRLHSRSSLPLACALLPSLLAAQQSEPAGSDRKRTDHAPPLAPAAELGAQDAGSPPGGLRLVDFGFGLMVAAGSSTAREDVLRRLEGGSHDPRSRGVTLQQAELSLAGAVDRWFRLDGHAVALVDPETGEGVFEVEEAFATTQGLPAGLQFKAGLYLTEFGRINQRHPEDWAWLDQPVIHSRIFGPDGMHAPGVRARWTLPGLPGTEWLVGLQEANGEAMASFLADEEAYLERPIGGRQFAPRATRSFADLVWSTRLQHGVELGAEWAAVAGGSAALGPNATGADANTAVFGVDLGLEWRPDRHPHGAPDLSFEAEWLWRAFDAAAQVDASVPTAPVALPAAVLRDQGGYLQANWGFAGDWAIGIRLEYATGTGDSYDPATQTFARSADVFRCDRARIAPVLTYRPSESSRLRLQYGYDRIDGEVPDVGEQVHSVWLGLDVRIGGHPGHGP